MGNSPGARSKPAKARVRSGAHLWLAVGGGLGLLLLGVVSWFALYSPAAAPTQRSAAASALGSTVPAKASGPLAPDFSVPTLEGGTFTLSAHRGKPVVLFFMAYWCGTCVPESQALAKLHHKYGDRLTIVALDVDLSSTPERLQTFRQWAGAPGYVWAFDQGQRVAQTYRVRALDTTIIINPAGEIVYTDAAPTPYQTLQQQIAQLLE